MVQTQNIIELALNIDPIDVTLRSSFTDRDLMSLPLKQQQRQFHIKSELECLRLDCHGLTPFADVEIVANRLFGPQPHTSTYLCIWEITVGAIQGSFTAKEAEMLSAIGASFSQGYADAFNAPAQEFVVAVERDGE